MAVLKGKQVKSEPQDAISLKKKNQALSIILGVWEDAAKSHFSCHDFHKLAFRFLFGITPSYALCVPTFSAVPGAP